MTTPPTPPIATEPIEHAALGCLLRMPYAEARELLRGADINVLFTTGRTRAVGHAITALIHDNIDPSPPIVLGQMQHDGLVPSWSTSAAPGIFLTELYGDAPAPMQFGYLLSNLQESALRRRIAQLAIRIGQAAGDSSITSLLELLEAEVTAVRACQQNTTEAP